MPDMTILPPPRLVDYQKHKAAFEAWLQGNLGAEILSPTNPYEVLRYRRLTKSTPTTHEKTVTVLYRKQSGVLTWQPLVETDFRRWMRELAILAAEEKGGVTPTKGKIGNQTFNDVLERDGLNCWLCDVPADLDAAPDEPHALTMEHILSKVHGGPNNAANLVPCHALCNRFLDSRAVSKKVELRDEVRAYMKESGAKDFHPKAMEAWYAQQKLNDVFGVKE